MVLYLGLCSCVTHTSTSLRVPIHTDTEERKRSRTQHVREPRTVTNLIKPAILATHHTNHGIRSRSGRAAAQPAREGGKQPSITL